jgi:TetR/AcrR family transcriptional repressor of bet genes
MVGNPAPVEVRREQILQAAFDVAAREGLGGVTVRAVAARAEVSHALVLFHFGRKEALLHALLERMIATAGVPRIPPEIERMPRALDRLHALLRQEMARMSQQADSTRLFFEYWALGARHPEIRRRIAEELERYRGAFRGIMEALVEAEPDTFAGATPDGLAAVAVGWVQGCAVQAMTDPDRFDMAAYLAAVRAIVGQLAPGENTP